MQLLYTQKLKKNEKNIITPTYLNRVYCHRSEDTVTSQSGVFFMSFLAYTCEKAENKKIAS